LAATTALFLGRCITFGGHRVFTLCAFDTGAFARFRALGHGSLALALAATAAALLLGCLFAFSGFRRRLALGHKLCSLLRLLLAAGFGGPGFRLCRLQRHQGGERVVLVHHG